MGRQHLRMFKDYRKTMTDLTADTIAKMIPSRIADVPSRSLGRKKEFKGTGIMNLMKSYLKALPNGEEVSILQSMCIESYIKTCLPLIYADEFEKHKPIILGMYNIERHQSIVIVRVSRRAGKSLTIVYYAYVITRACPKADVDIFAQSLSMSQTNLQKIRNMYMLVKDRNFTLVANNLNKLKIHVHGHELPVQICARSQLHNVSQTNINLIFCLLQLKWVWFLVWERKGIG